MLSGFYHVLIGMFLREELLSFYYPIIINIAAKIPIKQLLLEKQ